MSSIKTIIQFIKTHILYVLRVVARYYIAYNMFSYAFDLELILLQNE